MTTDLLTIEVDSSLKVKFTDICEEVGLSPSQAIELFTRAVINHGGIPLEVKTNQSNQVTLQAMQEIEEGKIHQALNTQQLFKDLEAEF